MFEKLVVPENPQQEFFWKLNIRIVLNLHLYPNTIQLSQIENSNKNCTFNQNPDMAHLSKYDTLIQNLAFLSNTAHLSKNCTFIRK